MSGAGPSSDPARNRAILPEAEALRRWLADHEGIEASIEPVPLPIPANVAGVSAQAVGGSADFYMFSEKPTYTLPFKAWAYFDTDQSQLQYEPDEDTLRNLPPEWLTDEERGQIIPFATDDEDTPF